MKGVTSIMGGQILDYEAKEILRNGKLQAYIELVKDGLITISEAAKRLDMDETEFKKYL